MPQPWCLSAAPQLLRWGGGHLRGMSVSTAGVSTAGVSTAGVSTAGVSTAGVGGT